jgi:flagellar assembly factor FliW
MKYAQQTTIEEPVEASRSTIQLPLGLMGFEKVKNYLLLGNDEEAPFLWLQMAEDPNLSFLVVPPGVAMKGYEPDISDEDAGVLGLKAPEDAWVLNIVTLHSEGRATVNLKGPLVLNRHTLIGKQIIPRNVSSFSLHHPLDISET